MAIGKYELGKAMKGTKTTWSQRGGQTAKNIMKQAPGHKMSAYETKQFLKESGMSKSGVKEVMGALNQPAQPKQESFKKPELPKSREMGQDTQRGGLKTPEWVEKVEKQGEISQGKFGRQIEEDVRLQKAGQQQQSMQRQPSSDVDRSRYSQEEVDRLEQKGQTEYFDKASQSSKFDKLDEAEKAEDAKMGQKIDEVLSGGQGGGGESGAGGAEK